MKVHYELSSYVEMKAAGKLVEKWQLTHALSGRPLGIGIRLRRLRPARREYVETVDLWRTEKGR